MPPTTTLWPRERHTEAKHEVLRKYLDRWIPILATLRARSNGITQLCLIDGFAGPGAYSKGEPGSPIVMLRAFLEHPQRDRIAKQAQLTYIFIENDRDRAAYLESEVSKLRPALPTGWVVRVQNADFAVAMPPLVKRLGAARPTPGTFVFIDPFGYAPDDTRPDLSAKILGYPHCEVLVFVPTQFMARFVDDPNLESTLDNLFGGEEWRPLRAEPTIARRIAGLRDLYVMRLRRDARYVRAFTIRGTNEFHLFFATNHELGLVKMKEAMWAVDRISGTTYADSTAPGQSVLFSGTADFGEIEKILRGAFASWFSYAQAERAILETPYLASHLKKDLTRLEQPGMVNFIPGIKRGQFQPDAQWRFRLG
jgi:three-Cys-motif partner protein